MEDLAKFFEHPPQTPVCEITPAGVNIRNIVLEDKVIDIGGGPGPYVLGLGAKFTDCEIQLRAEAHRATVHGATFINCRFVAQGIQEKLNWRNIVYEGCSFRGVFRFCSPGFRDAYDACHPAGMGGCDFSEARLDYCTLGNADLLTIVLPVTPHLFFFEPKKHREAINALVRDFPIQNFLQNTSFHDEQCSAVAYSIEYLAEKAYPSEQFDMLLRRCRDADFVRMNF